MKIFSSTKMLKNGQQDKNKDMQKVRTTPERLCKRQKEKMKHTNMRFITEKANTQESLPGDTNSDNLTGY